MLPLLLTSVSSARCAEILQTHWLDHVDHSPLLKSP
jgi:hypothetical protein